MTLKHSRFLIFALSIAVVAVSVTAGLRSANSSPQNATQTGGAKCDRLCLQAKVDRHLMLMGELGKDEALEASFRDVMSGGPALVRVVQDTYEQWSRPEANTLKGNARPGEMRWRAVHLLGSLNSQEATHFLYELARRPLPDPRRGEIEYADEYRVCLRAIGGLEKLKATEELKDLHEIGGVLRNPTAMSLFELGVNVGGVKLIEARKALAEAVADYKDHNQSKGRPPQLRKPGREKTQPTRRPDTPSLTRRQGD